MDTETIIVSFSYLGIFGLMISNGFISFPSSQVLYIIAGYFVFKGDLSLAAVIAVGTLGNTIGNIILYEAARSKGLAYLTKFQIFREKEIKKVEVVFQKKGAWFLAVGKLVPALKVFIPIPAGLAKMNRGLYIAIVFITSAIWSTPFLAIGYYFGKSSKVFGRYAIVMTLVAFVVMAVFYKFMNSEEVVAEIEK
ncbi:MAG: DedA family protein [Candidatus Paceibacterota bacterium]|jgi:membrane protein DedA with SNARE-associated domain|nr:DedA family protein [Candidatus Paceibacterota bacterium]